MAQEPPVYSAFSVRDHLRFGARLNPRWDAELAKNRIADLGLDLSQRAGKLSGGQRAQLALTLAIAKRPELLLLDEPVASLDPLARREFLQILMEKVADGEVSIVLSSHLVSDVERVCVANAPSSLPSAGRSPALQAQTAVQRCVDEFHLHTFVTYLPSSRYWALQCSEAVIFVAGAVALIAVGLWWIRNHVA